MAPVETPKSNEVATITLPLPPETAKTLNNLRSSIEKDHTSTELTKLQLEVEATNIGTQMKQAFDQLNSFLLTHEESRDKINDIKAYFLLLQHNKQPEVQEVTSIVADFTRSYYSKHARIAPLGEPKTSG
ncbi:hypothetical protein KC711_00690 [Candidatus Peregrinibacteria bacterium]|nr:hypothetical protein [Candidatus Peregrinibacteria bacterium]MCB9805147.1 hypothetical protein [Candidatus Peribacteria bacterium]